MWEVDVGFKMVERSGKMFCPVKVCSNKYFVNIKYLIMIEFIRVGLVNDFESVQLDYLILEIVLQDLYLI